MASVVELAQRGYALFLKGDVPTLIAELVDEDCQCILSGPRNTLPWAGAFRGKAGVAEFFSRLARSVDFTSFEPRQMIADGDSVAIVGVSTGQVKASGKTFRNEWVHVCRYRDGRLVYFRDYSDTAALVEAVGGASA